MLGRVGSDHSRWDRVLFYDWLSTKNKRSSAKITLLPPPPNPLQISGSRQKSAETIISYIPLKPIMWKKQPSVPSYNTASAFIKQWHNQVRKNAALNNAFSKKLLAIEANVVLTHRARVNNGLEMLSASSYGELACELLDDVARSLHFGSPWVTSECQLLAPRLSP